jgi:hypothetical protein
MKKILELKQAVEQLEACIAELSDAEKELSNWQYQDLHRRDGSSAQDARHEEFGREARDRVWQAKQKTESQKKLIATLTSAV